MVLTNEHVLHSFQQSVIALFLYFLRIHSGIVNLRKELKKHNIIVEITATKYWYLVTKINSHFLLTDT